MKEFMVFLKTYGVLGLAIAVVIGGKLNSMVTAFVEGLLMPLIAPLLGTAGENWRAATINLGGTDEAPFIQLGIGQVLGATLDFLIVALVVFLIAKKLLREEVVAKK